MESRNEGTGAWFWKRLCPWPTGYRDSDDGSDCDEIVTMVKIATEMTVITMTAVMVKVMMMMMAMKMLTLIMAMVMGMLLLLLTMIKTMAKTKSTAKACFVFLLSCKRSRAHSWAVAACCTHASRLKWPTRFGRRCTWA